MNHDELLELAHAMADDAQTTRVRVEVANDNQAPAWLHALCPHTARTVASDHAVGTLYLA